MSGHTHASLALSSKLEQPVAPEDSEELACDEEMHEDVLRLVLGSVGALIMHRRVFLLSCSV